MSTTRILEHATLIDPMAEVTPVRPRFRGFSNLFYLEYAENMLVRSAAGFCLLLALALVACGGEAVHSGPEPTVEWHPWGLQVAGVTGIATVSQEVPFTSGASWELIGDGFLAVRVIEGRTIGTVKLDLVGNDTLVILRDGELLRPDRAWVDVDGEQVAYTCIVACEVPGD